MGDPECGSRQSAFDCPTPTAYCRYFLMRIGPVKSRLPMGAPFMRSRS